jgi:uncharacterized protein
MKKVWKIFMSNGVRIIRAGDGSTNGWSGGKTTELLIYPPQTSYRERNFFWRVSVATVEEEQSTFSSLPGVTRTLILLKGEVVLSHQGHHQKKLSPFDQDTFQGDWQTTCYGKATDFNLMTRNQYKGRIESVLLGHDQTYSLTNPFDDHTPICVQVIYVWQGCVELTVCEQADMLYQGDACYIEAPTDIQERFITLTNRNQPTVHCIVTAVYHEDSPHW